jgi:hypothetical protein
MTDVQATTAAVRGFSIVKIPKVWTKRSTEKFKKQKQSCVLQHKPPSSER